MAISRISRIIWKGWRGLEITLIYKENCLTESMNSKMSGKIGMKYRTDRYENFMCYETLKEVTCLGLGSMYKGYKHQQLTSPQKKVSTIMRVVALKLFFKTLIIASNLFFYKWLRRNGYFWLLCNRFIK